MANKPFLIDVPVLLYIFVRPDTLIKVFDVIKKARPSILFIVSDGPREDVPTDKKKINESRRIVEDIDWNCKIHKLYYDSNKGMYSIFRIANDYVFSQVDRCIFLEDDNVPSLCYFKFCAELLEKYSNDLRINRICGFNHLGFFKEPSADYFFSFEGSIWGSAYWKRTYDNFDYQFRYGKDEYTLKNLKQNSTVMFYTKALSYFKGLYCDGHVAGPEFFLKLSLYLNNSINIVATKNMICNIGFTEGSAHTANSLNKMPKAIQKLFNMEIFEYDFPLKHPNYLVVDKNFTDKYYRILGWGYPIIQLYRRIESFIRQLTYYDRKIYIKRLIKKIFNNKFIEN